VWDAQNVDFDRDAFAALLKNKGYDVLWERAALCPNLPGSGLTKRDHPTNCKVCDRTGFVYFQPTKIDANTKMLMQGIKLDQSFYAYGRWDVGQMMVTAMPGYQLSQWDRLTLSNGRGTLTERPRRMPGTDTDVLRYAPLCVDYVTWVGRDGVAVVFTEEDYAFNGNSLTWITTARPDDNDYYSVVYEYRPRYVVLDLLHQHRDQVQDGVHYPFPVQAIAKLDYLVRDVGKDPAYATYDNPFPTG
jgi:hypothetical protein